jgi:PKD repeat protein
MLYDMRRMAVVVLVMAMLFPAVLAASIPDGPSASRSSSRILVAPSEQTQHAIKKIADGVSEEYILSYLTRLQGFGSRYVRAPGMYNTTAWLYNALLGNGRIQAELHDWSYVNASGVTHWVSNVILTLPGVDPASNRVYYLFNHADSTLTNWTNPGSPPDFWELMNMAPGADDDGTGVAATLEAARVLSRYQFQDTIRFAFFNGEEIGLVGSLYWVQAMAARGENVPASIDFDMIGTCPGTAPYELQLAANPASYGQVGYMMDVNSRYDLGLLIAPVQTSGSMRSDIDRFYAYGYPGVMGIEYTFSPSYHTKQDRVEYLNTTLVTKCSRLAVATLSEMARLLYVDVGVPPGKMTVSNDHPDEGEQVTVAVNVTNEGNLNASNLEVAFYSDGIHFASKRIWVPANGTNTTSAPWTAQTGNHRLSVTLDPGNEIAETDETNNTANLTVYVNDRPKAVLTATPLTALTNESVAFNGLLSSDAVGGITAYNFSFGDGNGTGWISIPTAAHSYPHSGSYMAILNVRDAGGAVSDSASIVMRVLNRGPMADPSCNRSGVLTYETVRFNSNASDPDGTVSTHWDFGDGTQSTELDPVHNYSKTGTYDVRITISDDEGATANYTLRLNVADRTPVCDINASASEGTIETDFWFNSSAYDPDGYIASYYWDIGDGNTSKSASARHLFGRPGSYLVILTVVDNDGSDSRDMMMITVRDMPPSAQATLSPAAVDTFQAVHFDGRGSLDLEGPVTFHWDFGDGNGSIDPAPSHAYKRPGDYSPRLTVVDSAGQNSTVNLSTVHVKNRPPKAQLRTFGCFTQNGIVYFDGTGSSDPEGDVTCRWSFGDGANATGVVVEHVFPAAGNFTVNLTVNDLDGNSSYAVIVVRVLAPPPDPRPVKTTETLVKDQGTLIIGLSMLSVILLTLLIVVAMIKRRG